jgi:phosphosulfolactate synthase (CoM biosynthesis protein A)
MIGAVTTLPGEVTAVSDSSTTSMALPALALNERARKPRSVGITEVRGQYYTVVGPRYLEDLLEVAGEWIDWIKIPGPGAALTPPAVLRRMADLARASDVKLGVGGLIEKVLTQGPKAVDGYFDALPDLGFEVVEISAGFLAIPDSDYLRLVERAAATGMTVKAEVGIQFGAGGTSEAEDLQAAGTGSVSHAISLARRALDSGAHFVVLESEGVTESVTTWRTDVPAALADAIGIEKIIFEAAEPKVFEWYIKNFGPEVNVFIDHSQALLLEAVRSGVWASNSLFNRVFTYKA